MGAMPILSITPRQIFDSRGNPTIEVELTTDQGVFISSCPSGASTGASEAHELRDGGSDYMGKGVTKALSNISKTIAPALIGLDESDQSSIDTKLISLDGTPNKSNLGANAILPVSMAVCRTAAAKAGVPLYQYINSLQPSASSATAEFRMPMPSFNIINGGEHAGNSLFVQEFMVQPSKAASFEAAMKMATEIYHHLKKNLKAQYGMNAASSFFDKEARKYNVRYKDGAEKKTLMSSDEMIAFYKGLVDKYPILLLEDPLDEEDWKGFAKMTREMHPEKFIVMGDDLLVTNPGRIEKAIEQKACNALLLKLNQIGTVTEAIKAVTMAKEKGWTVMTSHRSGETADDFIADLSVGLQTQMIKTGAPCRMERLVKYNRLMKIEKELEEKGMLKKW